MKNILADFMAKRKFTEAMFSSYGPILKLHTDSTFVTEFREPQVDAFNTLMPCLITGKSGLLAAPTAFGKSKVAGVILGYFGMKFCIVAAPKLGILNSFKETDRSWEFPKFGRINRYSSIEVPDRNGSKVAELVNAIRCYGGDREDVHLCSHATLVRLLKALQHEPELLAKCFIVIDEAHHTGHKDNEGEESNKLAKLMDLMYANNVQHLLMTATDFRVDGRLVVQPEHIDKYCVFRISLDEMHSAYSKAYVPDIRVSLLCYSKEKLSTLVQITDKSTEEKPFIANLEALKEIYWQEYTANPVPTLIQVPYAVLGTDKPNCEIALEIEDYFKARNPNIRILNLGGTRKTGKATLVSALSSKQKSAEYAQLKSERNLWDIVISIAVMDEGMDWPACERVFIPNVTTNAKRFIQRDIGRAARIYEDKLTGRIKNVSEVVYFISGMANDTKEEDEGMVECWSRQLVYFSLLFMGESVYGHFSKFPAKLLGMMRGGVSNAALPVSLNKRIIEQYYSERSSKEEDGSEWTIEDTTEFIGTNELLRDVSDADKIRIVQRIMKCPSNRFKDVLEDCVSRVSRDFNEFWKELPVSLRKFNVEEMMGNRGTMLTRMLLPIDMDGGKIKKAWRAWRGKFDDHQTWISKLNAFVKKHHRAPDINSPDLAERELAEWVEKCKKSTSVRRESMKLKGNK